MGRQDGGSTGPQAAQAVCLGWTFSGSAEPWGVEGLGEGSNLGSVWSMCPMQWLADSQEQEGLVASKKTKACMG